MGSAVAAALRGELSARCAALVARSRAVPRLAILRFEDDGPSARLCASVVRAATGGYGISPEVIAPAGRDPGWPSAARRSTSSTRTGAVAGIVIAEPLPTASRFGRAAHIDPAKDVDGATAVNAGSARAGHAGVPLRRRRWPSWRSLRRNDISIAGRRAVVVGRSAVIGGPVATLLVWRRRDGDDLPSADTRPRRGDASRRAPCCRGRPPRLIGADDGVPGCVVIDCGINTTSLGRRGRRRLRRGRPARVGDQPGARRRRPGHIDDARRPDVEAAERAAGATGS